MIVESPVKARKIKTMLPNDWIVEASSGHIRDLPEREIGVEPPEFKPTYVPNAKSQKRISALRKLAKSAQYVLLATDLDREGEAIAWHLSQVLKLKNPDRIVFNEITPSAIQSAIKNTRKVNIPMVAAQETRRVVDRIVGYLVSPAISRLSPTGEFLSAGRVQSVALRIVVDREHAIKNFTPIDHYKIKAEFTDPGRWHAYWDFAPILSQRGEETDYWLDQSSAIEFTNALSVNPMFQVHSIESKNSNRNAPAPFTTSVLQQAASVSLNFEPEKTMQVAQSLFDNGLITYHRTDSPNLCDEAIHDLRQYISELASSRNIKGLLPEKPNKWKSKGDAQEAHEAIRPTNIRQDAPNGISGDELKLYHLIRLRTLACQMSAAVYKTITVSLLSAAKFKGHHQRFVARGKSLLYPGWQMLTKKDASEETDPQAEPSPDEQILPELTKGLNIRASGILCEDKKTKAPSRYTQASLVKKLESEGIGRPSTYAAIMKTIKNRGYVKVSKKYLVPEPIGDQVTQILVSNGFKFVNLSYTRELEKVLDMVAKNELTYKSVVGRVYAGLSAELAALSDKLFDGDCFSCPQCGTGRLMRRKSKKNKQFYWACDNRSTCKAWYPDKQTRNSIPEPDLTVPSKPESIVSDVDCPCCGQHKMVSRRGQYGVFWSCGGYPKCKTSVPDDEGKPDLARISGLKEQSHAS